MGLEFYVKDKKLDRFEQSEWLNANKQANLAGACLTLSMAFAHLRREGVSPADIFTLLRASKLQETVVDIQKEYISGDESQELINYVMVSSSVLKVLVANRQAEKNKVVLKPLGQYKSDPDAVLREAKGKITERSGSGIVPGRGIPADAKRAGSGSIAQSPPTKLRPNMYLDLFAGMHPANHKLIILIFNCNGGNLSDTPGAHAIVVEDLRGRAGIFDPNFGWMELRSGYNSIDISFMLQAFKSEYDITDAHAVQDITAQHS
jgi:hypothetical protein